MVLCEQGKKKQRGELFCFSLIKIVLFFYLHFFKKGTNDIYVFLFYFSGVKT